MSRRWTADEIPDQGGRLAIVTGANTTAPGVEGGDYYGPDGFQEMRGFPKKLEAISDAYDPEIGLCLWRASEELTGVPYLLSGGKRSLP